MNILVTGGAGFLGQLLVQALCKRGTLPNTQDVESNIARITVLDQFSGAFQDPRVHYVCGDVSNGALIGTVVGLNTHAVFHLAAVVSGTAEADFELGMRVNLDGTRALLEALRMAQLAGAPRARLLFASSGAVFGTPLPDVLDDNTVARPQASYGVQKLMGELLVGDYSRKGFIDGRAVRIPTITVRPGKPNGAASSFASGIIREPLNGDASVCPVPPDTHMWVCSPARAIENFVKVFCLPEAAWGNNRALNLPGICVRVGDMVEVLKKLSNAETAARVTWQPDTRICKIVETWAVRFETTRANAFGLGRNQNVEEIVREYMVFLQAAKTSQTTQK